MNVPSPWTFDFYAASANEPVVVNGDRVLVEAECGTCHILFNSHLPSCPEDHE